MTSLTARGNPTDRMSSRPATAFRIAGVLLLALLLGACTAETSPADATTVATLYDESAMIALYEEAIPAVVKIVIVSEGDDIPEHQGFMIPDIEGIGSGILIDSDGHVLTNYHVVDGGGTLKIVLSSGETVDAVLLGTAPESDLALLKVDPADVREITPLTLGDSDTVKPGQMAIALGSPFNLQGSITVGVISGLGRSLTSPTRRLILDVIQTDAAVNPGNSGGPLLNSKGEVIGVNTAIDASSAGIGFAVPINTAKALLPSLIKGDEVKSAWLGVSGISLDTEMAEGLGLPVEAGVYVVEVRSDSPAERAGLRASPLSEDDSLLPGGDVITAVGDLNVDGVDDLIAYFNGKIPGDTVLLTIVRDGETLQIEARLEAWAEEAP